MLFLTGLLGLMALSSVAIIGTAEPDDDPSEGADAEGQRLGGDMLDNMDVGAFEAAEDQAGVTEPGSLFDQMGLSAAPQPEVATSSAPASADAQAPDTESQSVPRAPGLSHVEVGSPQDDTLWGDTDTDFLDGQAGDDMLMGGDAGDELHGGQGFDTLSGGAGDDSLSGEAGEDEMHGGDGHDSLFGYEGDDVLLGDAGDDELQGGLGDDHLEGGDGADSLMGREGADTLMGGHGLDTLFGGWDDDVLDGTLRDDSGADLDGQDYLNGGDGDDVIIGGRGDEISGGEGQDTLVLGDWITDQAAHLWDYDATDDQIVIVYDDSMQDAEPQLDLRVSDDDPATTEIVVDGKVLGIVATHQAPTPDMIVLVGESLADVLDLR